MGLDVFEHFGIHIGGQHQDRYPMYCCCLAGCVGTVRINLIVGGLGPHAVVNLKDYVYVDFGFDFFVKVFCKSEGEGEVIEFGPLGSGGRALCGTISVRDRKDSPDTNQDSKNCPFHAAARLPIVLIARIPDTPNNTA